MIKLEILPENTVKEMFGPIETIIKVSDVLLENFLVTDIAQSFLKVYGEYAKRYNDIILSIETYKLNSSPLRTFIQAQETRPEVSQRLQSLLIMPIQRIPRYEIILKECCLTLLDLDGLSKNEYNSLIVLINQKRESLCKFKDNESFYQYLMEEIKHDPEFKELKTLAYNLREPLDCRTIDYLRAYAGVLSLGSSINEEVRQNENQKLIEVLQAKFRSSKDQAVLISPSRKLIKYGLIKKVSNSSKFNDAVTGQQ
ncbi:hypothetical protein Ciccas_003706 [Cichlidogyrus casuarinus]|uniref:DH domain-containing protein n=1 Tax=Cichlidogyrus casuarinus TaxID=1844966 RepID=A0ABD2QDM8_9PLAT